MAVLTGLVYKDPDPTPGIPHPRGRVEAHVHLQHPLHRRPGFFEPRLDLGEDVIGVRRDVAREVRPDTRDEQEGCRRKPLASLKRSDVC